MSYFHVFLEKDYLSFSIQRNNIIFSGLKNTIFPDNTRKITFQCDFFEKTIFLEHLKKISYIHVFFLEKSSFTSYLKNKIIFSGRRNIIFPNNTRKIYSSAIFLERRFFQNIWKNKICFFVQC